MATIEKTVQHCWKQPEEYKPKLDGTKDSFTIAIESLRKMEPSQFFVAYTMHSHIGGVDLMNPSRLYEYIERLKEAGFDIGKGNSNQYGYRMPPPKKRIRQLIIFRRHL